MKSYARPLLNSTFWSLPTRERGLKSEWCRMRNGILSSLPTRERGLKSPVLHSWVLHGSSLPTRERGLKSILPAAPSEASLVAPYTGAWIEIQIRNLIREGKLVAPFAGAWIEIILVPPCTEKYDQSLPSRERGLKYFYVGLILLEQKSLPSRERGLK